MILLSDCPARPAQCPAKNWQPNGSGPGGFPLGVSHDENSSARFGCFFRDAARAGGGTPPNISVAHPETAAGDRYGFLNGLQEGSSYGQGVYPEPFMVDDSDLEINEFRLDELQSAAGSSHTSAFLLEFEKGFGQMTLELEVPFERASAAGRSEFNFANIDLGARYPFYQYVAAGDAWDTTFGAGIEVGIPTRSAIAKTTEAVPKIFNDTKIGNFTMQSVLGYSTFIGARGDGGGQQAFEYSFVFGYTLQHDRLPLPGVLQFIPVAELAGEKGVNRDTSNSLIGDVGFRANLQPIGSVQPRLGVVAVFPLSAAAREELHWGIYTSLVFDF